MDLYFFPREFPRVTTRVSNSPRSRTTEYRTENGFSLARRGGKWPRRNDAEVARLHTPFEISFDF